MRLGAGVLAAILVGVLSVPAWALELQGAAPVQVAVTLPDTWTLSVDGPWATADAPDHKAKARVLAHTKGTLPDLDAEAYLVDLIAQRWSTYTVDHHVKHVSCGRMTGVEVSGHGAGDSWESASFHLYLLVDPTNVQKAAVVLITGKTDGWGTTHPLLDRAVHAIH